MCKSLIKQKLTGVGVFTAFAIAILLNDDPQAQPASARGSSDIGFMKYWILLQKLVKCNLIDLVKWKMHVGTIHIWT